MRSLMGRGGISPSDAAKISALGSWGFWADSAHTQGAPQTISSGVRTLFTSNGLDATTETGFLYSGDAGLWSSNTIVPASEGDAFNARIGITVVPQSVSQGEFVEINLDIGSGSPINIVTDRIELTKGIGVAHVKTIAFPIFCLSNFIANGGKIYLTPSINVNVYGKKIMLQRTYAP